MQATGRTKSPGNEWHWRLLRSSEVEEVTWTHGPSDTNFKDEMCRIQREQLDDPQLHSRLKESGTFFESP